MAPEGYLRGVLADGARPFRHRARVRALLGLPEETGVRVDLVPRAPVVGFPYLRRSCESYGTGEGYLSGEAPVTASSWLDQTEHVFFDETAPVSSEQGPSPSAVDAPLVGTVRTGELAPAEEPPSGSPAPPVVSAASVVVPGTTERPGQSWTPPHPGFGGGTTAMVAPDPHGTQAPQGEPERPRQGTSGPASPSASSERREDSQGHNGDDGPATRSVDAATSAPGVRPRGSAATAPTPPAAGTGPSRPPRARPAAESTGTADAGVYAGGSPGDTGARPAQAARAERTAPKPAGPAAGWQPVSAPAQVSAAAGPAWPEPQTPVADLPSGAPAAVTRAVARPRPRPVPGRAAGSYAESEPRTAGPPSRAAATGRPAPPQAPQDQPPGTPTTVPLTVTVVQEPAPEAVGAAAFWARRHLGRLRGRMLR
ncbi:hypothetical protein [Streptomyces sp. H27-D2]|uniref:hypothetical protein n=1 Tax=Streptomyces sp. H27-D2 TaxID=3046304 RepID=UPI002DB74850|nr:hypothetical protein [Streptomyces sp. H27-D2]MEC4018798.1 hypothetical protein [Streptomyces sp. H27-D2]